MRFLSLLLVASAAASADPGLVVLDYQARGILDKTVLRELWTRTWEIGAGFPGSSFVPREETRKRIFDQNVLIPTRCDDACFQRLALKLQAGKLLVPSVEKVAEQLKFGFLLVDGSTGRRLQETTVWSDGRIDRALAAGISKVMAGNPGDTPVEIPTSFWTSLGLGAVGLGGALFLGLEQDRTPRQSAAPPQPGQGGI